jgi:hypothetical protein
MDASKALLQLERPVRDACVVDLVADGTYANVLKGCVVKSLEFAVQATTLPRGISAFFLAPTLRGICEDLIALRFLQLDSNRSKRDELLDGRMFSAVFSAVDKQTVFFRKHRPFQSVFNGKLTTPPKAAGLPSMKDMAEKADLTDLYEFLYAVSSDNVHFNPRIIIRNAWGDGHKTFTHSTKQFHDYYADLCTVYGTYLFCRFIESFKVDLRLSADVVSKTEQLSNDLDARLRWPEAVTFEEMNKDGPSDAERVLRKMIHEAKLRGQA